jgi:hypothetical protein
MSKIRPPINPGIIPFTGSAAITIIFLFLIAAGCTQPSDVPAPVLTVPNTTPVAATLSQPTTDITKNKMVTAVAHKPDPTRIIITYAGGRDADLLMELETTVIDDRGTTRTQSMGSRLGTTPAQSGGSDIFYGPFTEKTHVISIGYFSDGTHQDILDIWV